MPSLAHCSRKSSLLNHADHGIVNAAQPFMGGTVARKGREPDMNTVGGRIHAARVSKGLTMEQLADLVGVSKGAVSQWESGKIEKLSADNLLRLSDALEVAARWIWEYTTPAGDPIPMGKPKYLQIDEADLVETFQLLEPKYQDDLVRAAHEFLKRSASQQKPSRANPYPKAAARLKK
jgi:transcriptional regulator with XRE-family HTH domain